MKNKLFLWLKDLVQKENRARLAVLLGAAAMLPSCCRSCSPLRRSLQRPALPRRMRAPTVSSSSSSFPTSSRRWKAQGGPP